MKVITEKIDANVVELKVEVPVERVEDALQRAYKQVVRQITLPGFRKGKAPRKLLESRFGVEIFYEDALDILLNESYVEAIEEAQIEPVDTPEVKETNLEQGQPFTYTATVTVMPEPELGQYEGIEADKEIVNVSQEDIDKEIEATRESHSRLVTVEDEAKKGDTVVIDYEGFVDGEAFGGGQADNHLLELGSNSFIPGFEDQLIGTKAGDEVDVIVTFPENYQSDELAGKEAKFEVVVHEVKRKEVPELDEDFVLEVSEFETVEEYRKDVKEKLMEAKEQQAEAKFKNSLLNKVVENSNVEIPDALVESEIDRMLEDTKRSMQQYGIGIEQYAQMLGKTIEDLREDMREQAAKRVKTDLVLGAIVKKENIEINEEMFENRLAEMAQAYNQEVEELKKMLQAQPQAIESLQDGWKKDQAIELIVEKAIVNEVESTIEEVEQEVSEAEEVEQE
ncbi:MAG: trigger factor [Clostridia bacterium]